MHLNLYASRKENFPLEQESESEKLRKAKAAQGWEFLGAEGLTRTKFSQDAKFQEVPYQKEEDIKAKYLADLKRQYPDSDFEIELILDESTPKLRDIKDLSTEEEYKKIIENLTPENKSYLVFARTKKYHSPNSSPP